MRFLLGASVRADLALFAACTASLEWQEAFVGRDAAEKRELVDSLKAALSDVKQVHPSPPPSPFSF